MSTANDPQYERIALSNVQRSRAYMIRLFIVPNPVDFCPDAALSQQLPTSGSYLRRAVILRRILAVIRAKVDRLGTEGRYRCVLLAAEVGSCLVLSVLEHVLMSVVGCPGNGDHDWFPIPVVVVLPIAGFAPLPPPAAISNSFHQHS